MHSVTGSIQTKPINNLIATSPSDSEMEKLIYKEISMMNDFLQINKLQQLVNIEARLEIKYNRLLNMQNRYRGEQICYASYMKRFEEYQIFSFAGNLYNANGRPITTRSLNFDEGAILVMDQMGNLFLSHKKRDEIHHSTFLAGGRVAYACMLEVINGQIITEEPWSGHYTPSSLHQEQFNDRLNRNFTKKINDGFIAIFLTCIERKFEYQYTCSISHEPLFEAVKAPCQHNYNYSSVKNWQEQYKNSTLKCPLDKTSFVFSDCVPNPEVRLKVNDEYTKHITSIHKTNSEFCDKIKEINKQNSLPNTLDMEPIVGGDKSGIYLIIPENTPLNRVTEIAVKIGVVTDTKVLSYVSITGKGCQVWMEPGLSTMLAEIKEKERPSLLTLWWI
jgi:hypothetical protein